jgi:hypothetical protein
VKEDTWTAAPWFVLLALGMGIVAAVLWRLGERLWTTRFTHRDHREWVDLVRTILFQLIDAELHRAELMTQLAKLVGQKPKEFDDMAKEAFMRTLALTPIAAAKAEEVGLFEKGTFENMGVPRYDAIPATPPPPVQRAVEAVQTNVIEPAIQWVGTVAIPIRKSDRPPPNTEN